MPTPLLTCDVHDNSFCVLGARQPFSLPVDIQLDPHVGILSSGVLSKGFIYTTIVAHNLIEAPSTGYSSIFWFKIDIRTTHVDHVASIVDSGNLDLGPDFDLGTSTVAVDQYGNMLINFQVSGPTLPQSFGVIGRKASDPPGTLRYPPKLIVRGELSYFYGAPSGSTRQGDYTGIQADPDCFTDPPVIGRPKCDFYGIGQHPLNTSFSPPGILTQWSTSIYRTAFHPGRVGPSTGP
jgi:hypothetical protein